MSSTHFQLNQPVKIDGVDFEPGVYAIDKIDAGRRASIVNAGWGDYCDAPKPKADVSDDDDDDSPVVTPPAKPARSRKK
jgi:hypothetical protein